MEVLVVAEQAVGDDIARLAVDLADPAGVVDQHLVGDLDDLLRSHRVHAVVFGLEPGELVGALLDDLRGAEQHLGAARGGQLAPHARLEGLAGPGHRRVDGRLVGVGDLRDLLLGGRVEDGNQP